MKKSFQKFISVVLVALMLVTPLSSGIFALAESVTVDDSHQAVIAVPETVYMTPSTGESKVGQYYVNNTVTKGSYNVALEAEAANKDGYVEFYIPGAKSFTVAVNTVAGNVGDIVLGDPGATSGSYEGMTLTLDNNDGYYSARGIGLYINDTGLNPGQTALAEWVFTVTMNDGSVRTYYAYSTLYAPWYQPVGAAARAKGAYHNTFASSILWVSGVHGYSDGESNSRWYVQTANFLPMFGTIKAPENNNPDTNWIQSGSNGLSPTINYQSVEAGGVNYHARANSISPTANLTVDTSRYNNFNQIPNFSVGFMVTDRENANEGPNWYVSDFTGQTSSYYNGTATGSSEYSGDFNSAGTQFSSGNDSSTGVKYNGTWNKGITGTASFRIKSAVKTKTNKVIDSTAWNNNFVDINVTGANKTDLRKLVLEGASLNSKNYTPESWKAYKDELQKAAQRLGNPSDSSVDTTALTNARNALKTNITINLNGGTLDTATPTAITIGANSRVKISDKILAPTRTGHTFLGWSRSSGATDGNKDLEVSFNETVYAVWQANDYALLYDNLFNTLEFANTAASMQTNREGATATYNKAENSITVESKNVNDPDVYTSYGSDSKYYSIPVDGSTEYVFEFDVETNAGAQFHLFLYNSDGKRLVPSNRTYTFKTKDGKEGSGRDDNLSNDYMTVSATKDNSGHYVLKFRTPSDAQKMTVRFGNYSDVNVTSIFSNIRFIDAANYYEDVNYSETAKIYTYKDTTVYGTLCEATRTAYDFVGWYTLPNGGNPVDANTVNADKSTTLYSRWTPITYTIKFNTDGGSNEQDRNYTYEDTGNLPTPYKPGYAFDGWLVEEAGGNWQTGKTYYSIDKNYGDVTLKANFVDPGYQINLQFAYDEISHGEGPYPYNYHEGFTFTESMLPAKHGYRFTGWQVINSESSDWVNGTQFKLSDGKVIIPKGKESSVTLQAMWEIESYNINYNTDGGEGIDPTPYFITSEITLPTPTKAGWKFTGWTATSNDGSWTESYSAGQVLKGMYGNVTLKANWTANDYVVKLDPNGGTVNPTAIDYKITGSISIPTPTRTGYTFNYWKVQTEVGNWKGNVDGGATLREMYGDVTLVAQWTPISYTIIYDTQGEPISPTPYTIETELNIPTSVRNGFEFTGWTVKNPDGNWTQEGTINPGKLNPGKYGNVTLTANFTENTYTVTFNDANTKAILYKISETITIPELVKAGYTFKGWEVVESSGSWTKGTIINPGSLPNGRYGDVTLNPVFTPNNYKITFVPDGGIMNSDTLAYTPDDPTTLPTPTKTGYNFMGWKVTAPAGSWNADAVVEGGTSLEGMYGDVTLTALWEAQKFEITWVDGNGETLKTEQVAYGETPAYTGETPTKTATPEFTYTFNNTWSPAIVAVTEDATYEAQFDATVNSYTVTWMYQATESDEYTIVKSTFKYGEHPVFNNGAIPERKSDNEENHFYRFVRWVEENSTNGLDIVKGNITYIAEFIKVENPETVIWKVGNNEYITKWAIDETPSFPGSTILPDSNGEKHEITGWTPALSPVVDGGATYTATITSTPKEYKVNFILNGGIGYTEAVYDKVSQFPWMVTNKPGYEFTGWKLVKVDSEESHGWELDKTYHNTDTVQGNWGNVTFEAQWKPTDYTITVYSTSEQITYNIESTEKLYAAPKDGYVLSGWIIVSASGTGNWREGDIVAADKALAGMYGDVTVEPMWSAKPYKLTLISGLNGEEERVIEIKYGDIVDEYYPVAIPGYTANWDNELPETMPKEDVKLTAEYKPIQYFLNFDVAGGNKENGFYYDITSDKTIPVPTHNGAQFIQWVVADGNGSWYKGTTVSGNEALKGHYGSATLTAQWKLNNYTVRWEIDGSVKITQWYYGAVPSFDGTPYKAPDSNNSYKFIGWDKEITEVTGDVTYIAQFEAIERTYTVKWKIDNYTVEENYNLGDMPVYKGETPTRPATNEYEYVFLGWTPSIEAVDSDITYTAQFQTNIKLLSIRIDKPTLFMNVGDKDVLRAILSPATATNKDIIWSSSDESVVTIDEYGNIEAVGAGISVICVQSANGKVRAYSVVSVAPVINQYVVVSAGGVSTTRLSGQSIQLTATLMPENEIIKNVTWTSSNPEVAYVEESGLVIYGLVTGTAVITATVDGYTAGSIEVTTTDNSGDIVDRVKTYIVSFNASTSQYIIGDIVYDNISIVYAEGDTVEFLLTEPHFAMANGVQLERDTDGVFRIENIQQHYVISTTTRADIGFEDDSQDEAPKLSFFDKLKAFFQTIIDFFRNLFR